MQNNIYIHENEFLKLQKSDLHSILQVQTDGIRTCIFVAVKYSDETRGFAHIDAFTTQDAIKRFLNNASDINIAYAGEDCNLNNNPNRKQYAQEKYNELEANYAATPQEGRKYRYLLNRKDAKIETFNIASVLKEVDNDVKVDITCLPKDRIKCAYNITDEQMILKECPKADLSYQHNAIKQSDYVYKLGWHADVSQVYNIRHKAPRISVLQGNALVTKTLDEVFPPQSQRKSEQTKQTQDNIEKIEKFNNVLKELYQKNAELQKLTAENLISIFTDAHNNKYYTNAPSGKPKLPVDKDGKTLNTKEAKLMRKFSVKFQAECQEQGLTFSNTNKSGNVNGMRTKSVVDFLNKNNNDGDISALVKGAGWK